MKQMQRLALCGMTAALVMTSGALFAQEGNSEPSKQPQHHNHANFDPAQIQQAIKEHLGFTNDDEWVAVQPLVQKVMDVRRETMSGSGFGRMAFRPSSSGDANAPQGGGEKESRAAAFLKANPEVDALQKLIDNKASASEINAALARCRAARKEKEARLAAAQDELRKVLSVRQEAEAVVLGILP